MHSPTPPIVPTTDILRQQLINKIESSAEAYEAMLETNYFKEMSKLITVYHQDHSMFKLGKCGLYYFPCEG